MQENKSVLFTIVPVLFFISGLTQKGDMVTLDALEAGAIDYVAKPHQNIYDGIDEIEKELIQPEGFTNSFAQRLNDLSQVEVSEAKDGEIIGKGKVLIAPGNYHMVIRREGGQYKVKLGTGEKVSGHRPSVDVLFNSCAKYAGANCVGIILTGMGTDGAKGLLKMRNAGAATIGQDERSCVVYGMPKVAYDIGAVQIQKPLDQINNTLISVLNKMN